MDMQQASHYGLMMPIAKAPRHSFLPFPIFLLIICVIMDSIALHTHRLWSLCYLHKHLNASYTFHLSPFYLFDFFIPFSLSAGSLSLAAAAADQFPCFPLHAYLSSCSCLLMLPVAELASCIGLLE
jgi:hypothetical protein